MLIATQLEDVSLTSQTLNADGTPKRPMNAFMIFARRRRPQVSAENQSMRTGEISKLLSKEWTTMQMSEKQFYLDQAKILKENFNSKYPDYVYRRRPNNTRK
ncbi:HMG-box, partial [Macrolepiota fuliginosa MF-IS2]